MSSSNNTNITGAYVPLVGESIFANPSGAPFLIFVGLSIILIVVTIIAIIIMIRQHDKHLKRINAVRGFHQGDIEQGNEILKHLEKENNNSQSGGMRRFSTSSGRSNSIGMSGGLDMRRMSTSVNTNQSSAQSGGAGGGQHHQHQHRPHRLIYDFHHTPPQPELGNENSGGSGAFDLGSPGAAGRNNNNLPPLDLGALGGDGGTPLGLASPASSGSFAKSTRRGVGMESMRRRNM